MTTAEVRKKYGQPCKLLRTQKEYDDILEYAETYWGIYEQPWVNLHNKGMGGYPDHYVRMRAYVWEDSEGKYILTYYEGDKNIYFLRKP